MHECPNCGVIMDHQQADLSVGVVGCWVCDECDITVSDDDDYDESDL
jgi:ribosomal protein S27AE